MSKTPSTNDTRWNSTKSDRPTRNDSGDDRGGERSFDRKPWSDRRSGERSFDRKPWSDRRSGERSFDRKPWSDRRSGERSFDRKPWSDRRSQGGDRQDIKTIIMKREKQVVFFKYIFNLPEIKDLKKRLFGYQTKIENLKIETKDLPKKENLNITDSTKKNKIVRKIEITSNEKKEEIKSLQVECKKIKIEIENLIKKESYFFNSVIETIEKETDKEQSISREPSSRPIPKEIPDTETE